MSPLIAGILGTLIGATLALALRPRVRPPAPPEPEVAPPAGDAHTASLAEAGRNLAAVAHELNNPLTAILAFAQDLLQAAPTAEQREALLVIQQQARRSRMIVRGLLDSVRTTPPGEEYLDPQDLLGRVVIVCDRTCREAGLAFTWQADDDLPWLEGDPGELEQVLANLLQNAVQATPAGGRVSLVARVRGRLLEFVVQDSGPGIPTELLERIFDPFFTTKPPGDGTGLGLSVSQAIVRRHRGTLVAENLPPGEGGGARFVASFPFVERRRKKRMQVEEREQAPAAPGGRVLVVEDEESIRVAVRRFLERRGWTVVAAGDGDVALRQLASARFDAVLCDLHIPGPSGMDVYDRGLVANPDLAGRFILLSGDASALPVKEFLTRTGTQLLEKPFELRALARAVEQAAARPASPS